MIKSEDFGTETDGNPSRDYCCHCFSDSSLREDVTIEALTVDIQELVNIEAAHPNLLSDPLLDYIKVWLPLDEAEKRLIFQHCSLCLSKGKIAISPELNGKKSGLPMGRSVIA